MAKKGSKKKNQLKFVTVSSKSYGAALKGMRIYYEGRKPKGLNKDGSIKFGKHILEALKSKFKKFHWILTEETDDITEFRKIMRVRISRRLLAKMEEENWDRRRDIMNIIVRRFFYVTFPTYFTNPGTSIYVPGTIADIIKPDIVHSLSSEDKEAITNFLPSFLASEQAKAVSKLKAEAQIKTLRELANHLEREMDKNHGEPWWQDFIKANILLMQQGYIKALDKLNVAIGDQKFPDFCLITHANYLDILEIKRPNTELLKRDDSRGNYYWQPELSKAIIQAENYIEHVANNADRLRTYLRDTEKLEVKVDAKIVRPKGIILAGDARRFNQKQGDDFRLLSQGIKNIEVVTYDELLARVNNYIHVLEQFSGKAKKPRGKSKSSA